MKILVINAGSSSLKYQLIDMQTEKAIAGGVVEKIGINGSRLVHKAKGKKIVIEKEIPDHKTAIELVLNALVDKDYGAIESMKEIDAVGHRMLHSGGDFDKSMPATEEVLKICAQNADLAPLHQKANIMGVTSCKEVMGDIPMAVTFDTAFHATMPEKAYIYGLPYEYYEKYKVRRYGAHGTSHRFVSEEAAKYLNADKNNFKVITCHLGNGSSISAVKNGKCIDTSMSFTPLGGVPMGTRTGDLDPAILEYLSDKTGMDIHELLFMCNKKAGVYGISGGWSDFRDLAGQAENGNKRAQLALDVFTYSCKKYIGAYAAALGGVDCVVFTAGIGEHDALVRRDITEGLEFLGIKIDEKKNDNLGDGICDITADGGKVRVLVIPTNEELVIARDTAEIVREQQTKR